jgi:hypothetical protein
MPMEVYRATEVSNWVMASGCSSTDCVYGKDSNDFVPLGSRIWLPSELLREASCEVVDAIFDVEGRVGPSRQTADEGVFRVSQRVPSVVLIQNKVVDGDGVGRVIGELRDPFRRVEGHGG